jgi:hypothetical protein
LRSDKCLINTEIQFGTHSDHPPTDYFITGLAAS